MAARKLQLAGFGLKLGCFACRYACEKFVHASMQPSVCAGDSERSTRDVRLLVGRECTAGAWHRQAKICNIADPDLASAQVTSSGERTMRTCLGAAAELQSAAQLPAGWVTGATLVHCEGYVLYRPAFARDVLRAARRARALVHQTCMSSSVRECANVNAHKPGVLQGQCAVHPAIVLVVLCKYLCAPEFTSSEKRDHCCFRLFLVLVGICIWTIGKLLPDK